MTTPDRLKAARGNLSQAKAAALLDIPLRTWEDWERGARTPPEYVIALIEMALNIGRPRPVMRGRKESKMQENLGYRETHILSEIINNQNCLDNPEKYPYAKPYTLSSLPCQDDDGEFDLFPELPDPDRVCTVSDIYYLSEHGMIDIGDDGVIRPTAPGTAYLGALAK